MHSKYPEFSDVNASHSHSSAANFVWPKVKFSSLILYDVGHDFYFPKTLKQKELFKRTKAKLTNSKQPSATQQSKMTSSSLRSGNASDDYQEESGILDGQMLEDQLIDAFDNLTAKSAKTRLVSFEIIRKTLSERYMVEFIFTRKITILDAISRCIKRSKGQDLGFAAHLIAVICATIGQSPETDPIISELVSQLLVPLADQTVSSDVRAKCARTIAICTYIIGVGGYVEQVMDRLFAIFSASCAKKDGSMPTPNEQIALLHSSCLQAWTFLLTSVISTSPDCALTLIEENMDKIVELLDSPNLDLKISAGECLAVMVETIKSQNDDVTADDFEDLCDKIRDLVNDTQKFRGKKDLRQQRSNFREILATIEEDETPNVVIKFGRERLVLESWLRRRQYEAFCELFGTGLNQHLAENEVLRDIFGLGAVLTHMDLPRIKRSDNSYENMLADKIRTKNLRRLRDKRAEVID